MFDVISDCSGKTTSTLLFIYDGECAKGQYLDTLGQANLPM